MLLWLAAPAGGQTLDYGDLEGLFDEPVTLSATGKPERISDTAVTMDVITAADIRRSGARDLVTLLRTLPGINGYHGYNGTQPFSIGSLFLNGREIYLTSFGDLFLAALPVALEEIRQIEVIRGPQSALYGFNAGEGVINIITFDPAKDPLDDVTLRVGNQARRDGTAILTQVLTPGIGLRLSAGGEHSHYDNSDGPGVNLGGANNPDRRFLSANVSAWLGNGDHASFETAHSDISVTSMAPQINDLLNARLQTDSVKGGYSADSAVGRLSASAFYTAQTIPQASSQAGGMFNLHDHTTDLKLSDLFKATPDDSARVEAELRSEIVHTSAAPGSLSTLMLAGSGMWQHQFDPDWSLVNALRYYSNENHQDGAMAGDAGAPHSYGLAYNSSLIDKLGADDSLRASLSRGIALPSQLDFEKLGLATQVGRTLTLANDPNLTRSPTLEYRLSWDHQWRDWAALSRLSLFSRNSVDAVTLLPVQILAQFDPACLAGYPGAAALCQALASQAALSGIFDGAELQIDHKSPEGWRWGANYTLERLHPHGLGADDRVVPGLQRSQTYHKVNANLGYGWNGWAADVRLYYASPVPELTLIAAAASALQLQDSKDIVSLAPHLSWAPRDDLSLDLAADNLWAYRETPLQRVGASYFLTLRLAY